MKTKVVFLTVALLSGSAEWSRAQTSAAPASAPPVASALDGVLMKDGHMMAMKNGQMSPMAANMPLTNGTTARPDGKLLLPDGQWMPLRNGEQVKMNGRIMPAPQPPLRRVTRFNKHVSNGMMK